MKLILRACPASKGLCCGSGGAWLAAILGLMVAFNGEAFSLLGPYADWMDVTKGYRLPGDIGGPVNLNEGYRWNIPVISYGFDRSFIDYFGSNGVAAVEEAIGIFNQLPWASGVDPSSWPSNVWCYDYRAGWYLQDLKSRAVGVLLEALGLADPMRYTWCIRDYSAFGSGSTTEYAFYVIQRNFDPITYLPSTYVNGGVVSYEIRQWPPAVWPGVQCDAQEVIQSSPTFGLPAASQFDYWCWWFGDWWEYGGYLTNLTRDDIGGLKYLLYASGGRWETLPPDTHVSGTNTSELVQTAFRSGIGKLTFVRHPAGTLNGQFRPFTNTWTDWYKSDGHWSYQEVRRVRSRPDILFTAADLGPHVDVLRTGTTNWVNHADLNGNPGGVGPGVIHPPITMSFNSAAPLMANESLGTNRFPGQASHIPRIWWASLGDTNRAVVQYPEAQTGFRSSEVRFRLDVGARTNELRWSLPTPAYGRFLFQTSPDLSQWTTLRALTNTGGNVTCEFQAQADEPARFFRTVRQ